MSRGLNRERQVRVVLENEDWVVIRAAGSFGPADLVAMRAGSRTRAIEVKSTIGPYSHFGPADRADIIAWSLRADADPWLAWWPKNGKLHWIAASEWPALKAVTA